MGYLSGLKGVAKDKKIDCLFISKGNEIEEILRKDLAATSAGSKGALNVYKDDAGKIRCELLKFMITIEEKAFTDIAKAVKWADKWLPKIK